MICIKLSNKILNKKHFTGNSISQEPNFNPDKMVPAQVKFLYRGIYEPLNLINFIFKLKIFTHILK